MSEPTIRVWITRGGGRSLHRVEVFSLNGRGDELLYTDQTDLSRDLPRRKMARAIQAAAVRKSIDRTEEEWIAELLRALQSYEEQQRVAGATPAPAAAPKEAEKATDLGNAERLRRLHGADLRHCHPWHQDLTWDGRRWRVDDTAQVERWAKEAVKRIYQEAAEAADEHDRARLAKHAVASEDARHIRAMVSLVRSESGIPVLPDQLDADPFLLNCLNGTLDLRTGQLREHSREDLITKLCPVTYDPGAGCPLWLKFLARIMDGNEDLVGYLQRVVGYALTGDVSEQCLWFLYGCGANGKSTFLSTVLAVMGDYGMQTVSDLLMVKHNESHPTERADLLGRRFVATIETEQGKRLAEALMKQLTGGDRIRARRMRQDFFEFLPTHKIFLAANHKPTIRGTDYGVWRRIKTVPFTVTIPDEEKDKDLPAKLHGELPGILNWALTGCRAWQRNGLGEPDEVRQATAAYRAEQDAVQGFLAESCHLYREAKTKASALFDAYQRWSGDRIMTPRAFGDRLREKGYESKRGHGGAYFWHGIGPAEIGPGEPS